jgi:hypothetical protein
VYTVPHIRREDQAMKNITLSADEKLIEAARARAIAEQSTLNEQFRRWLREYVAQDERREMALTELRRMRGVLPATFKFDRDEANARR